MGTVWSRIESRRSLKATTETKQEEVEQQTVKQPEEVNQLVYSTTSVVQENFHGKKKTKKKLVQSNVEVRFF